MEIINYRFLRFRFLKKEKGEAYLTRSEGVFKSFDGEPDASTFAKEFNYPLNGVLEVEYPASYGYVEFIDGKPSEMVYTTKNA